MGRITIFACDDCTESQRIRVKLDQLSLPYKEISLTSHPRRRVDMIKLSNRLTTPQVFFNTKHIGGAMETINLLEQHEREAKFSEYSTVYERMKFEVYDQTFPKDEKRLRLNKDTPIMITLGVLSEECLSEVSCDEQNCDEQNGASPLYDSIKLATGHVSTIGEITRKLLKSLPRSPYIHSRKVYSNCFSGKDAIKVFLDEFGFVTRKDALEFGKYLQQLGIIHNVRVKNPNSVLKSFDRKEFYRLQPLHTPKILNSFRIYNQHSHKDEPDPVITLVRLTRMMNFVISSSTNGNNVAIDYDIARNSSVFTQFEEDSCQLQLVNMKNLNLRSKVTFSINVYNLMVRHAFVRYGPKKIGPKFFSSVKYNLGGFVFSLDDIYHGILRSNAVHPDTGVRLFSHSDPRYDLILPGRDARIHFTLNSGMSSCAVVHEYNEEAIDEELRVSAEIFCASDENVKVDLDQNVLILAKFMKKYVSDFTKDNGINHLPKRIVRYLVGSKRKMLIKMMRKAKASSSEIKIKFKGCDRHTTASIPEDNSFISDFFESPEKLDLTQKSKKVNAIVKLLPGKQFSSSNGERQSKIFSKKNIFSSSTLLNIPFIDYIKRRQQFWRKIENSGESFVSNNSSLCCAQSLTSLSSTLAPLERARSGDNSSVSSQTDKEIFFSDEISETSSRSLSFSEGDDSSVVDSFTIACDDASRNNSLTFSAGDKIENIFSLEDAIASPKQVDEGVVQEDDFSKPFETIEFQSIETNPALTPNRSSKPMKFPSPSSQQTRSTVKETPESKSSIKVKKWDSDLALPFLDLSDEGHLSGPPRTIRVGDAKLKILLADGAITIPNKVETELSQTDDMDDMSSLNDSGSYLNGDDTNSLSHEKFDIDLDAINPSGSIAMPLDIEDNNIFPDDSTFEEIFNS